MRRIVIIIALFLLALATSLMVSNVTFAQEKPTAALAPMGALGELDEIKKRIFFNSLQESLSKYYTLTSQKMYEKAEEEAFQVMDADECTEDQCIAIIQELLQVEYFFMFEILQSGNFQQMKITRVDIDGNRDVRTTTCEDCNISKTNSKVDDLVQSVFKEFEIQKENGLDEEAWKIVKDSENPTDLQFFIDHFPDSMLLPTARMRMKVLNAREERLRLEAEKKLAESTPAPQEVTPRVSAGKIMYAPRDFFNHVVEYRGHTYALTRYRYNFQGAQYMAERFGGHLVTVDDRGENLMLTSQFRDQHNDHAVWIGFSDRENEGKFLWEDGSSGGVFSYSNWGDWQPDNWKDQEDCTELRFKTWNPKHMPIGGWNDTRCSGRYLTFVEWDGTGLPRNLEEAKSNPTVPTAQLEGSGFGMGWKLSALAVTFGAGMSALNQAKTYNDLAGKNKALREQYSTANTAEERSSLETEYANNQKQMKSVKTSIRNLDVVTLVGVLALAYMFTADYEDPVRVVGDARFPEPARSGFLLGLLENHLQMGWRWNF